MEDRDWIILQTLYEHKNITKTAQSLYISQPALTARLQQIEKEFNTKIVQRTTRGVNFTPQGEFLAKASADVILHLRTIKEQVANLDNKVSGTLRIGASSYLTMYTLPPLLKQFQDLYPNVEFNLTTTWSKDIFNQVYNHEVHIGFISSDYGWQDKKHLLFEEPIYVASMDDISFKELPNLPRINYRSDSLIRAMIDRWWRENFPSPPLVSMEVEKLATCKEMIKSGLGYAIMPSRILNDIPQSKKVLLLDKQGNPLLRRTWMIYYGESLEINLIRSFVNFIKQIDLSETYTS